VTAQGILGKILEHKRQEVASASARVPISALRDQARSAPPPRDFAAALRALPRPRVIAEIKRASPSAGPIRQGADAPSIAREYQAHGAAAISVLTDETFFAGSLHDLEAVRAAVGVPVLRKDFVVDAYQVVEARAFGADAVLLIVAALEDALLRELFEEATTLGMGVLVEVHDAAEAERAVHVGARVIGVNHRDLATFQMDMGLCAKLRPHVPLGTVLVGESGIRSPDDVRRLVEIGADAILVGEALMRQPSPGQALRELLA
jgi:indole-3-glycerol phosphate synthase